MASESSEELTVSVDLPADLVEWLDEEATAADVDRETAVAQLLASYQTMSKLEGELDSDAAEFNTTGVLETLEERVSENLQAEIQKEIEARDWEADTLREEFQSQLESTESEVDDQIAALEEGLREDIASVEADIDDRIAGVESDVEQKITDIRKRVVQVKKETDKKAPEDHTHAALDDIADLEGEIAELTDQLEQLATEYEQTVPEQTDQTDENTDRLDELQERLQTVAWVVNDLRDQSGQDGLAPVDRIKRAAAKADIERAACENCGQGVTISLMTEPRCPHCEATLSNVEPASGWFGDPKLTVPSKLESGENR